jgi:hypothetical protein
MRALALQHAHADHTCATGQRQQLRAAWGKLHESRGVPTRADLLAGRRLMFDAGVVRAVG